MKSGADFGILCGNFMPSSCGTFAPRPDHTQHARVAEHVNCHALTLSHSKHNWLPQIPACRCKYIDKYKAKTGTNTDKYRYRDTYTDMYRYRYRYVQIQICIDTDTDKDMYKYRYVQIQIQMSCILLSIPNTTGSLQI